ncbi:RNA polymerase sigma factor [Streptosporangium lutulentum]
MVATRRFRPGVQRPLRRDPSLHRAAPGRQRRRRPRGRHLPRRLPRPRPLRRRPGRVRPWLYGIATNILARHRRSEVRRWRALSRAGTDERVEGHESTVATKVAAGQVTGRLAGALAGLAKRDRDVVLLVALAELTHAEVAAALGIPYGTVASRLNRARKQLRKALGDVNPLKEAHDG